MAANSNLTNAKRLKNDEFYTMYEDIEKELIHYEDQIKQHAIYIPCGAAVYCNCDNPSYSNFFEYFCRHAVDLKLKWVAATWYDINDPDKESTFAAMFKYPEELNPDDYDPDDWKDYVNRFEIPGNGSFDSEASIEIMKQADIVVTNPPFSLFRKFIETLEKYNKKYLILGNLNAITYKEIFPLIKDNKLWLGYTIHSGDVEFQVPNIYEINSKSLRIDENGKRFVRVPGIRWYTNIDHLKRHERLELMKSYTGHEDEYPKYDNYDAIEVSKTITIPNDYNGIMGVPISWLDKYCPTLFEIIGGFQEDICSCRIDKNYRQLGYKFVKQDGITPSTAGALKDKTSPKIQGKGSTDYSIAPDGTFLNAVYARIFIRRRPEDIERYGNR